MAAAFTLPALLERAAGESPDSVALSAQGETWSYAQLAAAAGGVSLALRQLGVEPGDRVAVRAAKSVRTVAALYGVMRSGAAYVPIDPAAPPRRAEAILADADCRALCGDAPGVELAGGIPTLGLEVEPIGATVEWEALDSGGVPGPVAGCESDLAYILYTSGSTGTPKGVMLTHRNALAFVEWAVGRFAIGSRDRLVSHAPFHFDLSILDLYVAAAAGASVHCLRPGEEMLGASMAAAVRELELTVWYSVPSALILLCDAAGTEDLERLRTVLFAGEVFPMKHLRRLRALAPQATLANLYGPTETNVCTYEVADAELPEADEPLPIGRACENQDVFALDEQQSLVPEGEVGELWVRGPTVMKGYWRSPELTEERLWQNPLHDLFPDPTYRTGDLVRSLQGGRYAFIGRRDHQIKSRGYRIELGEIEVALTNHSVVRDAAAVPVPDERSGTKIVGFVSAGEPIEEPELRKHCAERLPRYMVPAVVRVEADLPRTSTGKIDRQALEERAADLLGGDTA